MEIVRKICEKAEVLHESVEKFRKNCTFLNLCSGEAPYLRSMKRKRLWVMLPLVAGLTACDDFAFRHDLQEQGELRWVLDVTILSNLVLDRILGIKDLRTNKRIDFVGGIRGLGELSRRVDSGEMAVAFALYPVSMKQLTDIADTGNIMPPKTTWFEPKLRSGLAIHSLD